MKQLYFIIIGGLLIFSFLLNNIIFSNSKNDSYIIASNNQNTFDLDNKIAPLEDKENIDVNSIYGISQRQDTVRRTNYTIENIAEIEDRIFLKNDTITLYKPFKVSLKRDNFDALNYYP
ncbi:MAG: hypothetical protein H0X63_11655 [Flavobacteriales bacterium]|nr:hypothetical protein [Flavobacteriales bacterium]